MTRQFCDRCGVELRSDYIGGNSAWEITVGCSLYHLCWTDYKEWGELVLNFFTARTNQGTMDAVGAKNGK